MNRNALRYAFRGIYGWFMVLITGAYILAASLAHSPVGTTVIYALVFAVIAVIAFAVRYKVDVEDQRATARYAKRDAEIERLKAEHQAVMAKLEAERVEREEQRARELREDVLAGRRCPAWCDNCDEERRESDRNHAAFLADRAQRHGHPNAADVEIIDHVSV